MPIRSVRVSPPKPTCSSSSYLMTGFHALHVVMGLIVLGIVTWHDSLENMETGAAFWHIVDLIWVLLYPLVYLLRWTMTVLTRTWAILMALTVLSLLAGRPGGEGSIGLLGSGLVLMAATSRPIRSSRISSASSVPAPVGG